jgi:hypothetical protein
MISSPDSRDKSDIRSFNTRDWTWVLNIGLHKNYRCCVRQNARYPSIIKGGVKSGSKRHHAASSGIILKPRAVVPAAVHVEA